MQKLNLLLKKDSKDILLEQYTRKCNVKYAKHENNSEDGGR